ncbi:MAG: cytochrome c biogenesis protein CcsA [Chloroflexi bacterium]|nr:cytochrome c biogenesis protein CcsA [Chloroflexota bacterium]
MENSSRYLKLLNLVTALLLLAATAMVFLYAPRETTMGEVQRIFYFHVPSAWVGMLAFAVTFVAGILYLRTGDRKWDRVGVSSVEIGLVFTVMATASGSIWARPAWNTWWTWDPRLVTYTIMGLLYVAYLMLRQSVEDPERQLRFAAVYAIVAFISVPITFFSIRWWRTIHPVVIGNAAESAKGQFSMTSPMRLTFFFSLFAFTVFYVALLWNRVRLARLAERVEELKMKLMAA